jgi:acetyl-CoA acetyltransferase
LLRTPEPVASQNTSELQTEVAVIFANGLREGALPPADKSYLAHVVTSRTGISGPEAAKRVDDVFAQAQQAADQARKAIAHSMYWTFLALLVGAFSASFAATIGGRQRDRVVTI